MGDREYSFLKRWRRCSWRLGPTMWRNGIWGWSKCSKRFRALFVVRTGQPPFARFAAIFLPCASKGVPRWLRWRPSSLALHSRSLGDLSSYDIIKLSEVGRWDRFYDASPLFVKVMSWNFLLGSSQSGSSFFSLAEHKVLSLFVRKLWPLEKFCVISRNFRHELIPRWA